jgi:ribosome-binding protein aMBF1 (putative translation factor)
LRQLFPEKQQQNHTTMPDEPTEPTKPTEKKPRKSPGLIDQTLLNLLKVAEDCHRIVQDDAAIRARVETRGWSSQTELGNSIQACHRAIEDIKSARAKKQTRTTEEVHARAALLVALNPVIIAARDKYPKESAERASYGHGQKLENAATSDLIALAKYVVSQLTSDAPAAPKDNLPGLLAEEITAIVTLYHTYKDADWAQTRAKRTAEEALIALESEVNGTLVTLRRKLQAKADLAFPHTDKTNAATRKLFHIPPDKRAID